MVGLREISYFLKPSPGREYAVKGLAAQARMDLTNSTPVSLGRRPYDWILESQWQSQLVRKSRFFVGSCVQEGTSQPSSILVHVVRVE